jgi:hypothetical protein
MLYGPSNAATSETETLAHDADVRVAPGQRAPMKAARAPTSPTELALNHGHGPTQRGGARRITQWEGHESPPAFRRSNQKHRRRASSADSRQLVARVWPNRSSHPEYPRENELGAVRITVYGVDRNGSLAGYNVPQFTSPITAMCNERGMIARERWPLPPHVNPRAEGIRAGHARIHADRTRRARRGYLLNVTGLPPTSPALSSVDIARATRAKTRPAVCHSRRSGASAPFGLACPELVSHDGPYRRALARKDRLVTNKSRRPKSLIGGILPAPPQGRGAVHTCDDRSALLT